MRRGGGALLGRTVAFAGGADPAHHPAGTGAGAPGGGAVHSEYDQCQII